MSIGTLFTLFCGCYYRFPKITGYMYSEKLGILHFWMSFIGVNMTFFPQHFVGLAGMPRRYADYPDAFAGWNLVSSIGAYITVVGLVVFFYCIAQSFRQGNKALDNPWGDGATTLEWTLTSPPPFHAYESLPVIR